MVTITFSFIGSGNNNHIVATLADVKFSEKDIVYQNSLEVKTINVYPNPAIDRFTVSFMSDKNETLNMELVEMGSGKVILNKQVNATIGTNVIPVTVNSAIIADGHYVVMLGNGAIRYKPFKIGLRR